MTVRRATLPPPGLLGTTAPPTRLPLLLHGRWLWIGRAVWVVYATIAIGLAVARLPTDYTRSLTFTGIGAPQSAILREGLSRLGISPAAYAIYRVVLDQTVALVNLAIAVLLIRRKSSEGVVVLVALLLVAGIWATDPPSLIALSATHPIQATLGKALTITRMTLLPMLFFVFPDGRFIPRWGLVPLGIWFVQLVGVMFFPGTPLDSWDWPPLPTALSFSLIFGPALYAQVFRYRRISGPVERQQAKWAIGGLLVAVAGFIALNVWLAAQNNQWSEASPVRAVLADFLFNTAFTLAFAAIPVALAVAIFKYRLFAIDPIINRALVYGGLTVGIVALYILIVGGVSAIFRIGDNLAVALVATGVIAVVFQPLHGWVQRGANRLVYGERDEPYAVISRLGRRLEGTLAANAILPTLVETVAGALKLPYAALVLRRGDVTTIAAEYPVVVGVSERTAARTLHTLPLAYQGESVGELRLALRPGETSFGPSDQRLLADLARQVGVVVHAVRLATDLQRTRERLVLAREEERRRLRRDLHDGLGPRLAALTLRLETAHDLLADDPRAAALLSDLAQRMAEAVTDTRRLVYALRPPSLDDLGLVGALHQAAESYRPGGLPIDVEAYGPQGNCLPSLPAAVEVAAYRIAQEALTNVVKHAGARRCTIRLTFDVANATLIVEVDDDGGGIAVGRSVGVGLRSMRERAEEIGGVCTVLPLPTGGTQVRVLLPCDVTASDTRGEG